MSNALGWARLAVAAGRLEDARRILDDVARTASRASVRAVLGTAVELSALGSAGSGDAENHYEA